MLMVPPPTSGALNDSDSGTTDTADVAIGAPAASAESADCTSGSPHAVTATRPNAPDANSRANVDNRGTAAR